MKRVALLAFLLVCTAPAQQPAAERVKLAPQFQPGQVLRYQVDFRTRTESSSAGPVEDPQGASALEVNIGMQVRLEVLPPTDTPAAEGAKQGATPPVHFRATYEKAAATLKADSADPFAAEIEAFYKQLEGRSIEIFVGPEKVVTDLSGLGDLAQDQRAGSAHEWLTQLLRGIRSPAEGVTIGQAWSREEPVPNAPLAGMVWRTVSTYLRNEGCSALEVIQDPDEPCAVVLTRFEMTRHDAAADPTPPDYKERGLRTSGSLTGTGESLSYVSLRTGLLVGATQTAAEEMNLTVTSTAAQSRVQYQGRVASTSHVRLMPPSTR